MRILNEFSWVGEVVSFANYKGSFKVNRELSSDISSLDDIRRIYEQKGNIAVSFSKRECIGYLSTLGYNDNDGNWHEGFKYASASKSKKHIYCVPGICLSNDDEGDDGIDVSGDEKLIFIEDFDNDPNCPSFYIRPLRDMKYILSFMAWNGNTGKIADHVYELERV